MRTAILTIGLLAAPRAALACPVCFGDSNSPLAIATKAGIIFMLAIVAVVLCGFASFFIYLMRRGRLAAAQEGPAEVGHAFRSESDAQEGTAQC